MAHSLPERDSLPRYLAPLPRALEDIGLRFAWLIVAINLLGTAFGFWYYVPQLSATPEAMWPFVPDSPVATLLIAGSLASWKLGRRIEPLNVLAFFGCIILGLWTPYVLVVFREGFSALPWYMYGFLFTSHLAMVVEAFLIYRYSDFPLGAIALAAGWYALNVVVDYVVPVVGSPHHTLLPAQDAGEYLGPFLGKATYAGPITHVSPDHGLAAAGAVGVLLLATALALGTHRAKGATTTR